jgi:putative ABC transport system permease protein
MNLFQLVLKQMRQRSLSTWLTLLSVLLGVALASSIMLFGREAEKVFVQTEYGYDVVIGAKGSRLQLVLNSVYHMDQSPGNIPYAFYEQLTTTDPYRRQVRWAVPFAVGDNYMGHRVVATLPRIFGIDERGEPIDPERTFQYRPERRFSFSQGRAFAPNRLEAVIGSDIPARTGLRIGDRFQVEHGLAEGARPDDHEEEWTVVGILEPTYTANDRVIFIPLMSFYAIDDHHVALDAIARRQQRDVAAVPGVEVTEPDETMPVVEAFEPQGVQGELVELDLPKERWMVSGVWVRSRGPFQASDLMWFVNNGLVATAANPASEMRQFFDRFFDNSMRVLLVVSLLVTVVAAVSILVSIYNSVSARNREIAILRALGATRTRVLTIICVEAGLIGLVGGLLGLLAGRILGAIGSQYFRLYTGQGIDWMVIGRNEWLYLLVVVLIALVAGLVPALKAYRTPVATNLVAAT